MVFPEAVQSRHSSQEELSWVYRPVGDGRCRMACLAAIGNASERSRSERGIGCWWGTAGVPKLLCRWFLRAVGVGRDVSKKVLVPRSPKKMVQCLGGRSATEHHSTFTSAKRSSIDISPDPDTAGHSGRRECGGPRADGGLLIVYRTHIDLNGLACVNPRIHHAAAAGLSSGFWQRLQYSSGGLSTRSPAAAVAALRLQQRRLQ